MGCSGIADECKHRQQKNELRTCSNDRSLQIASCVIKRYVAKHGHRPLGFQHIYRLAGCSMIRRVGFGILCVYFLFSDHLFSVDSAQAQDARTALPANWPQVTDVEAQPLIASVKRLSTALELAQVLGRWPTQAKLEQAYAASDADAIKQLQQILDPLCLAAVSINPESRVKVGGRFRTAGTDAAWLANVSGQGS